MDRLLFVRSRYLTANHVCPVPDADENPRDNASRDATLDASGCKPHLTHVLVCVEETRSADARRARQRHRRLRRDSTDDAVSFCRRRHDVVSFHRRSLVHGVHPDVDVFVLAKDPDQRSVGLWCTEAERCVREQIQFERGSHTDPQNRIKSTFRAKGAR